MGLSDDCHASVSELSQIVCDELARAAEVKASARAALFATYPSALAAWDTLILSSSLTASGRVRARDAEAVDTAAARATSVSVAWLPRGLGRRLPRVVTVIVTR